MKHSKLMITLIAGGAATLAGSLAVHAGSVDVQVAEETGKAGENARAGFDGAGLAAILDARPDEDKARDEYRHPAETLEFFGLTRDMTVIEALPGGGWYSRILIPYVNEAGGYGAANYDAEMFRALMPDASEERLASFAAFPETFPARAAEIGASGEVAAWTFGAMPESLDGTAEAFLFIRALHNLNRSGGAYLDAALADAYAVLKPGGVLGVVQHRAPAEAEGDAASGANGYLRQADVIAMMEKAGFEFEAASEINANPADQPGPEDIVWRLPPSLGMGDENREAFLAIGESDRMTLRFRKPAE